MSDQLKKIIRGIVLVPGALLLSGFYHCLKAQDATSAFDKLNVGMSVQANTNRNIFHRYWDPGPGLQVDFSSPFYYGEISVSGRYFQFQKKVADVPDIDNLQVALGWGERFLLAPRLELGGDVGVLFSIFSFKNISPEHKLRARNRFGSTSPESEIGFEYGADLSYRISPDWALGVGWRRSIVYTDTKLKLNYAGFTITRSMRMPSWLREVLR